MEGEGRGGTLSPDTRKTQGARESQGNGNTGHRSIGSAGLARLSRMQRRREALFEVTRVEGATKEERSKGKEKQRRVRRGVEGLADEGSACPARGVIPPPPWPETHRV